MRSGTLFEKVKGRASRIPYLDHLGIELLEVGEGHVRMKLNFRPEFLQPAVVHGGVVYSLADASAAHALLSLVPEDEAIVTVSQSISFIKATREQDLYCDARIIHAGRTLAHAEATVTLEGGTLVANSTATLMRLGPAAR